MNRIEPAPIPAGFETPEGYVLVTHDSWHTFQTVTKMLTVLLVLVLGAVVVLQFQLSGRNHTISEVHRAADRAAAAGKQAAVAANAAKQTLDAAIAQSQGGPGADLAQNSAVALRQIEAVCRVTVSPAQCDAIRAKVMEQFAAAIAEQKAAAEKIKPPGD